MHYHTFQQCFHYKYNITALNSTNRPHPFIYPGCGRFLSKLFCFLLRMLKLMLFVVMSLLQHHVLDLHKSDLSASLILIKASCLYTLCPPGSRDNDMLKSIYAPSGLLYLRCEHLAGLLNLRQPQHIRKYIREGLHCIIQLSGCKCKSI